jgi:hypothetical protein
MGDEGAAYNPWNELDGADAREVMTRTLEVLDRAETDEDRELMNDQVAPFWTAANMIAFSEMEQEKSKKFGIRSRGTMPAPPETTITRNEYKEGFGLF